MSFGVAIWYFISIIMCAVPNQNNIILSSSKLLVNCSLKQEAQHFVPPYDTVQIRPEIVPTLDMHEQKQSLGKQYMWNV